MRCLHWIPSNSPIQFSNFFSKSVHSYIHYLPIDCSSSPGWSLAVGFTVKRSMILAGGIPAILQLVSMLLRLTLLEELASVTIDSLSRSRSPPILVDISPV